ncbi:MAG: glycoside hydrolase family 3 C-terminal domain-containing protein [Planctomycetes bacterium]|nr:glycoside hydrolase family 3 C-terminal domain-containing protein [Planctomycetota bacterium]
MSLNKALFIALLLCASLFQQSMAYNAPACQDTGGMNGVEIAKKVAEEGMVLLKNKVPNGSKAKALPLAEKERVALFGVNQIDYIHGGGGSGNFVAEYYISLYKGLMEKSVKSGLYLYRNLVKIHKAYFDECWKNDISYSYGTRQGAVLMAKGEMTLSEAQVLDARSNANTAIISIGRPAGEDKDRKNIKGDFQLSDAEVDMIAKVKAANFDKVIVILNVTGVMETSWFVDDDAIDAALLVFLPGMVGGHAMADVLCGDSYPSGKLASTWAESYEDYPSSNNFGKQYVAKYEEDIFVGYRYFETIPGAANKVNYEFGYGLSYADFDMGKAEFKVEGIGRNRKVEVSVVVTNKSSEHAGKEVVQVYYSAPEGNLTQAAKELVAFEKTKELGPRESQTITLSFPFDDMSSYDDVGKTGNRAAYILEPGDYQIHVGRSVRNTRHAGTYSLNRLEVCEQLSNRLVPNTKNLTRRLTSNGSYEPLMQTVNANPTPQPEKEKFLNPPKSNDPFITFKAYIYPQIPCRDKAY